LIDQNFFSVDEWQYIGCNGRFGQKIDFYIDCFFKRLLDFALDMLKDNKALVGYFTLGG